MSKPPVRQTTVASDFSNITRDGLSEAVAGDVARFSIQAKDTYGNNRLTGGDSFQVLLEHTNAANVRYQGNVVDRGNGEYAVDYTAMLAGEYLAKVTLNGLPVLTCQPARGRRWQRRQG